MLYIIGILAVAVILFALCLTQDKTLDAERDFWIKYYQLKEQASLNPSSSEFS